MVPQGLSVVGCRLYVRRKVQRKVYGGMCLRVSGFSQGCWYKKKA